ncbi:MAG TPA: hypothetical protein VFH28_06035 [Nitrososphaera sp.]|nr:hypothetical protein [Nitrososphaera sp.]
MGTRKLLVTIHGAKCGGGRTTDLFMSKKGLSYISIMTSEEEQLELKPI